MFNFSKSQFSLLADFFNDVAKGLFLGITVNQVIPSGISFLSKLAVSIGGLLIIVIFLYTALYLSNFGEEKIW